jgi:NADH dehydrogenase
VILIAGGTGRLGTLVVRRLARDGVEVRVLTRDAARAHHLSDSAVEIVVGDVRDPSTLPHAMRGVTTVVSAVQGFDGPGRVSPASVDRVGNAHLVDAAAAVGADVVLLSVVGASSDSPMELFRAKYAAEQHLRASTAPWTIVRATAFIELWAKILAKPIVFGRGDNPINFVSVHDVAAVVARAVVDPGLRGQTIDVGGPDNLTMNQLVVELQSVRGDTRKVRHIPRAVLRAIAPLSRKAAAAVAMDTIDLMFHPDASATAVTHLPLTDSRTALRSIAV